MMFALARLTAALFLAAMGSALAQDPGTVEDKTLPPLEHPNSPSTPAKELFGRKSTPDPAAARSIGFYSRGCLAGAVALPINGATWQVMRLSRNRNWGHPKLVAFLERLADKAKKVGWNGLLVGDMSQPRGGPMLTGHTSHQIGLDADIWLTPMPDRKLSREEREFMSATMAVWEDRRVVDPNVWTRAHSELIRVAAEDPAVERIFVTAAIKKALCREAGSDRAGLAKVRPWHGHDYHFHVRIFCPPDSPQCEPQPPPQSAKPNRRRMRRTERDRCCRVPTLLFQGAGGRTRRERVLRQSRGRTARSARRPRGMTMP